MKISLVIPTYNEAKTIEEILAQFQDIRGTNFEIIITDNGSRDNTVELARPLCDKVVALPTDIRTTIGECRNRGARAASGEILWFIDADVQVPSLKQVRKYIIEAFNNNQQLAALTLPIRIYKDDERLADRFWFGFTNMLTWLQNQVLHTGGAPGDVQIIRRNIFERVKGFKPDMATSEDHDLFMRLVKQGSVRMVWKYPIRMSARRIHRDGWSKTLYTWGRNWMNQFIFKKEDHTEWEARR